MAARRRRAAAPASAALVLLLAAAAAAAAPPRCEQAPGNLVGNCGFAKGLEGWTSQAVTTLAFDERRGVPAPGALRMTNQPARVAGAATCVGVVGGATYELAGWLQRLDGPGECLALLEEHAAADCGKGASAFHTVAQEPLVHGSFKEVRGSAKVRRDTVAVRAAFACYGETDDDVQSVLLDNVVLRQVERPAGT
jgi:hypothetical protein